MSQVASASLTTSSLYFYEKKTQPELGQITAIGTTKYIY
jgi:hypothetical protein